MRLYVVNSQNVHPFEHGMGGHAQCSGQPIFGLFSPKQLLEHRFSTDAPKNAIVRITARMKQFQIVRQILAKSDAWIQAYHC